MWWLRSLVVALTLAASSVSAQWAVFQDNGSGSGLSGQFLQLPVDGGGFVTDLQFANDGTIVAQTDTATGSYRTSGATKFHSLVTASSMPVADAVIGNGGIGICAGAIAPTNSAHVYMYFSPLTGASPQPAYPYASTNSAQTWARGDATFPSTTALCNANGGEYRLHNHYMRVSPADENTVYFGTPSDGVFFSTNGMTTITQISTGTIPAAASQGNLVDFDATDATGNRGAISSYGHGIWKCTSMRSTPSCSELNSTNMPTTFHAVYFDPLGVLWVIDDSSGGGGGNIWQCNSSCLNSGGAWVEQLVAGGNPWTGIAMDPGRTTNLYVGRSDGCLNYTQNAQFAGSISWVGCAGTPWQVTGTTNVVWSWAADTFLSLNTLAFDPSASHVLYAGNGVGIYNTTAPNSGTAATTQWNADASLGISNLDVTDGRGLPGGGVVWTAQDRPLWFYSNISYPTRYYPDNTGGEIRWGFSPTSNATATTYGVTLNTIVGTECAGVAISTTGINGTYNYICATATGLPAGNAGKLIALDSSHYIWLINVSGNPEPYFTANSGTSWSACTFSGGTPPTASSPGWVDMAQDTTSPGIVTIVGSGANTTGFWENNSTSSCSFTQTSASVPSGLIQHLVAVPGKSCELYASYWQYVHQPPFPGNGNAYRIQGCGATQGSAISGVNSIFAAGVGLSKSGNDGYPALIYQGYYNNGVTNTFSIWEIDNADTGSPIAIDLDTFDNGSANKGYPIGNLDEVIYISGDLAIYGRVYGGFAQSGTFYRHE